MDECHKRQDYYIPYYGHLHCKNINENIQLATRHLVHYNWMFLDNLQRNIRTREKYFCFLTVILSSKDI